MTENMRPASVPTMEPVAEIVYEVEHANDKCDYCQRIFKDHKKIVGGGSFGKREVTFICPTSVFK